MLVIESQPHLDQEGYFTSVIGCQKADTDSMQAVAVNITEFAVD